MKCPHCLKHIRIEVTNNNKAKRKELILKHITKERTLHKHYVTLRMNGYNLKQRTFHRDIKSYLGMEDAGVRKFNTLHAHVHWVYCSYILLHDFNDDDSVGIKMKQEILVSFIEVGKLKKIVQKTTQFNGLRQVNSYCYKVIANMETVYGQ